MKVTKSYIKQLVKEELRKVLREEEEEEYTFEDEQKIEKAKKIADQIGMKFLKNIHLSQYNGQSKPQTFDWEVFEIGSNFVTLYSYGQFAWENSYGDSVSDTMKISVNPEKLSDGSIEFRELELYGDLRDLERFFEEVRAWNKYHN